MNRTELIHHLRQLGNREIEPLDQTVGMCQEVSSTLDRDRYDTMNEVIRCFPRWSKYSGNMRFPIPSTIEDTTAMSQYLRTNNKWSNTEYGDLRRELCLWIADCFERAS